MRLGAKTLLCAITCAWVGSAHAASGNAKAAFQAGADLPAAQLHIPASVIIEAWEKNPAALAKQEDRDLIVQLNLEAATLWESILACNPGDAEAARAGYFAGIGLCPDPGHSAALRKQLDAYGARVQGVLETALLREPQAGTELPLIHPLLTQAVLEQLALDLKFYSVDRQSQSDSFMTEFNRLWFLNLGWNDPASPSVAEKGADERRAARRVYNCVSFMQLLPTSRCASWGLWPTVTMTVIHTPLHRADFMMIKPLVNLLARSWKACPGVRPWEELDFLGRRRTPSGLIDELRQLGRRR